ncbi:MAG: low molecular weight phosphotyrosine protein phosphatase [Propionibacteriaceae bacterium]|nr:low molecular weight phosphotyrosine protein phosphatase [Propionibacteriaceae bacterium]
MTSVVFVCWGNICRSPMAEQVAREWATREGIAATFTSAGVSAEEQGNPIDHRAAAVLRQSGYPVTPHRAHRITADEIRHAGLVIGMERLHLDRMRRLVPEADNLALLTDFDPEVVPGSPVDDPWYGPPSGFRDTLASVEAAMPGLMRRIADLAQAPA